MSASLHRQDVSSWTLRQGSCNMHCPFMVCLAMRHCHFLNSSELIVQHFLQLRKPGGSWHCGLSFPV